MEYRKFGKTGIELSVLGFGCMRLPLSGETPEDIDENLAIEMIRRAIDSGVNYVDTAWPYHGRGFAFPGKSELLVAKALEGGYREKVHLATKLPSWLVKTRADMDNFLNAQLDRLGTDHIDMYLLHTLDRKKWENLKELGVVDFLDKAIADGRIKYAGFSFHDELALFKEIVDHYDWSFCQIQYNYLDQNYQAGKEGLKYAAAKGMGVVVMEPLRGGNLAADIPAQALELMNRESPDLSPVDWALKWIWNDPDVSTVLSGMSLMSHVEQNLLSAEQGRAGAMTPAELSVIDRVIDIYSSRVTVSCTACGYCMPCPFGVDIPRNFRLYNDYHLFDDEKNRNTAIGRYRFALAQSEMASSCTECGKCESLCPQGISIINELKNVRKILEDG